MTELVTDPTKLVPVEPRPTNEAPGSTHHHRPDITGLRAVAVLLVLLFHAGLGCPGGFVGVDVFFVISGYLITGVILRDFEAGTFSLPEFWHRRVRRIMPAALVVTAAVLIAGQWTLMPRGLIRLAESAIAHQLFWANFYFGQAGGYFDGSADLKPLLHTWSLAVEEQFYFAYPFLLLACRRKPRRETVCVLAATCLASLALSAAMTDRYPIANFYWSPPRAWELLVGGLLAMAPPVAIPARYRHLLGALGLTAIVGSALVYSEALPFPGATALVPTLGTGALLYAGGLGWTVTGWLLSLRPLVWVGAASYSIYLWHWPILAYLRIEDGRKLPFNTRVGAVLVGLVIGFISWRLVEEPIRRKRVFPARRSLFELCVGSAAGLLAVSLFFIHYGGLPERTVARAGAAAEDQRAALARIVEAEIEAGNTPYPGLACGLPRDTVSIGIKGSDFDPCRVEDPKFLLWGDSHAGVLRKLCDQLAKDRGISGYRAALGGHTPLLGVYTAIDAITSPEKQVEWNASLFNLVRERGIKHVILACRWESKLRGYKKGGRWYDLMGDARTTQASPEDAQRAFRDGLHRTLGTMQAAGIKLWVLSQVPVQDEDLVDQLVRGKVKAEGNRPPGISRAEYETQQRPAQEVFRQFSSPFFALLGPAPNWFDAEGHSRLVEGGESCYIDDDHVSDHGAEVYYRALLGPVFDEIAGRSGRQ